VPSGTDDVVNIRLRDPLVKPSTDRQLADHRAVAENVPRGGVVNARRPGRRPGRSAAKSIDDAEHGAIVNARWCDAWIWIRKRDVSGGNIRTGHERVSVWFVRRFLPANVATKTGTQAARSSCTT